MKRMFVNLKFIIVVIVSLSMFAGCATAPLGPTVMAMPAQGKPLDMFQQEVKDCKKWAFDQMGGEEAVEKARETAASHAAVGTLLGGALGAVLGAAIGDPARGAAWGAGTGAAVGTASGAQNSANSNAQLQNLYNNYYIQCMYAKGNQVPGIMNGTQSAPMPPVQPQ